MKKTTPSRFWAPTAVLIAGAASLSLSLLAFAAPAAASRGLDLDRDDVQTVFAIRKSSNRNRVDYGVRTDGACIPKGSEPVVPYWRMLERGANAVEPLGAFERRAYGVDSQRVARGADGGSVRMRLRAVDDRDVIVRTSRRAGRCDAIAVTTISGTKATLDDVYVVLAGPLSVDHVELRGTAVASGEAVAETLRR